MYFNASLKYFELPCVWVVRHNKLALDFASSYVNPVKQLCVYGCVCLWVHVWAPTAQFEMYCAFSKLPKQSENWVLFFKVVIHI